MAKRNVAKNENNLFIYVFPATELRIAKSIEARRDQKWLRASTLGWLVT
jgi:hypothetical protein